MKVAILHLSDFHIKEVYLKNYFKITKIIDSLNEFDEIDKIIIAFTGDLSNSGKASEFKKSRWIIGKIIADIKTSLNLQYVELLMVPGNHDMLFDENTHDSNFIINAYAENKIEDLFFEECSRVSNFYEYSHANSMKSSNKPINKKIINCGNDYKIQFNLLNTTPFSTLKMDNKELHYIPINALKYLKREQDINLSITLMHHSYEWFHWSCKDILYKNLVDNSDFVLSGHDHISYNKKSVEKNNGELIISCGGNISFDTNDSQDSYNIFILDTVNDTFNSFIFNWNKNEKMFIKEIIYENEKINLCTNKIKPLKSFIEKLDEDLFNNKKRLSEYFVFPNVYIEDTSDCEKYTELKCMDDFIQYLEYEKLVEINCAECLGKTSIINQAYLKIKDTKFPLIYSCEDGININKKSFVKQLFEEQYGDEKYLFDKFNQINKDEKILFIDDFDKIKDGPNKIKFISEIKKQFGTVVIATKNENYNLVGNVENELTNEENFKILKIKPFYEEKRNVLIKKICKLDQKIDTDSMDKLINIVNSMVIGNSMFSLEPLFIIQYTKYFIEKGAIEYVRGEDTFGAIFENNIKSSIIHNTKKMT